MKKSIYCLRSLFMLIVFFSCNKPTDYKKYLKNGEIEYPGSIVNAQAFGGNNRAMLTWMPSSDQTISKYMVYWHNGLDSLLFTPTTTDPSKLEKVFINNLSETEVYSFTIYSYNSKGDKSIPIVINGIRVYGAFYISALKNRQFSTYSQSNDSITFSWNKPDTVNVTTKVKYTSTSGGQKTLDVNPDSSNFVIPDYQRNTLIYYQSAYKPADNSPDTFYVTHYDSFKVVYQYAGTYTSNGYLYHPSSSRSISNLSKSVVSAGDNSVTVDLGDLGSSGYKALLTIDASNSVTITAAPGAAGAPYTMFTAGLPSTNPGYTPQWGGSAQCNNTYDPATKTFYLRYGYLGGTGWRVTEEIIKKN